MTTDKPARQTWIRRVEVLGAVALGLVLLLMWFDWNMLRGPIERRVSQATGREFHIEGDLDVDLSLKPRVTVGRMVLGNVPGAKDPQMASVDRLQFRLHLLKLLGGDVVLSQVKVDRPDILLETDRSGRGNWIFPKGEAEWPTILQLEVSRGALVYRNPSNDTDMHFVVASGEADADARLAPLVIDGKGRYAGNAMQVDGRIESPLALRDPGKPYHIDLRARAGSTRATAEGDLIQPLQMQGFDLRFGLAGPNMALLYPLLGLALPDTPPYSLSGRLGREGKTWHYNDFTGKIGDSDMAGDASVDVSKPIPFLRADLVSRRLDFDDLAGFVGAPPQTTRGETASPEQQRDAARLRASAKILPSRDFDLVKLRRMDADVKLKAHRVNAPSLPIESMSGHLFLEGGVVRLDPLDFDVAGGSISSVIRLDASKPVIASSMKVRARGLQLPKLFPRAELTEGSTGRIAGTLDLAGNGNSVARMLATSDGEVGLIMGSGRISNLMLEFAGIDIAEALKFLLTGDRMVPIRCAFADFEVKQGVMNSRRLAFDTTDTVIYGEGNVSLASETLDLTLKPQPKDRSILSLRAPLRVDGSFKDPEFHPDLARMTLRGVAAAVLGAFAPPAALLAVYESGPGKDVACRPGT
jgi:uncharacterized protein involved in outer membrane biogenesis